MHTDRMLLVTLSISTLAHVAVITQSPNFNFLTLRESHNKIAVSYIKKVPPEKKSAPANGHAAAAPKIAKIEPFFEIPQKITMKTNIPPPIFDKEAILNANKQAGNSKLEIAKPALAKPDIISIKRRITIPAIDLSKINNPSYISYYQVVYEKIRRAAYQNFSGTDTGEVTASFIVSSLGYLQELRLDEEKSTSNSYLKQIVIKSIKDASPFPAFPKEIEQPQLSFNATISFEIE